MTVFRLCLLSLTAIGACRPSAPDPRGPDADARRLPTGRMLDPAGIVRPVGQMPLGMLPSPDGSHLVLLLGGWREHGLQVIARDGGIAQTLPLTAAFVGLVFSRDGRMLYFRSGNALLRAPIESGALLGAGRPSRVFEGTFAAGGRFALANYDVSPDGRRFVMVEAGSPSESQERVGVIVNFFSEVNRLQPARP